MSEVAEMWADLAKHSQEKRANNRQSSAQLLKARGIAFESKNADAHLIVTAGSTLVDFWPGTGLWIERKGTGKGRGVMRLLGFIKKQREVNE